MFDQSGSMTVARDEKHDKLSALLHEQIIGNSDSLKKIFDDMASNKSEKYNAPLILSGSPGVGKTKMIKDFYEILDKQSKNVENKLPEENFKNLNIILTGNKVEDLNSNNKPDLSGIDIKGLASRFRSISMLPINDEELQKIADKQIEKSGITGAHRDAVTEIIRNEITAGTLGGVSGARGLIQRIDALTGNADHPDIVAHRAAKAEALVRQAEARVLHASRAQGTTLATLLATGAQVTIKPLKPIRFK